MVKERRKIDEGDWSESETEEQDVSEAESESEEEVKPTD